jgi:hypothetical protein
LAVSSEGVRRTADAQPATVENMGVDHGCLHILVAEKFLNGPNVIAISEKPLRHHRGR